MPPLPTAVHWPNRASHEALKTALCFSAAPARLSLYGLKLTEAAMNRRSFLQRCGMAVPGAFAFGLLPVPSLAHHGWGWATDQEFELTGEITAVQLGNPHGEVTLNVKGEKWIVEVGQPWRNERAGLTPKLLAKGQVMTAHGHRSANKGQRLMKAERLVIAGKSYNLYPDRAS